MKLKSIVAVAVLLAFGGAAVAQEPAKTQEPPAADHTAAAAAAAAVTNDPSYKIGPQDVLRIDVWKEPEISRTEPVRPDGKISLPLLNDVQAAGLTPMELANVIGLGLKKYINAPQVTVSVTEINSRRIYVNGEVNKPGAFALLPGMTALQALSSSGGFTQFANRKKIYVLRNENGKQVKHPFNYKDVVDGKTPDMPLQSGDIIVVP
jgi:polysaccharide export outer membrane protein